MALSVVYNYTNGNNFYNDINIHESWYPLLNNFLKQWELLTQVYKRSTGNLIPSEQYRILSPLNGIKVEDIETVWFENEPNPKGWGGDTMNDKFIKTLGSDIDTFRKTNNHLFVFKCWSAITNSDNDSNQFWYSFNIDLINLILQSNKKQVKFVVIGPDLKKITSYIKKKTNRIINVEDPRVGYVQKNLQKFEELNAFLKS